MLYQSCFLKFFRSTQQCSISIHLFYCFTCFLFLGQSVLVLIISSSHWVRGRVQVSLVQTPWPNFNLGILAWGRMFVEAGTDCEWIHNIVLFFMFNCYLLSFTGKSHVCKGRLDSKVMFVLLNFFTLSELLTWT